MQKYINKRLFTFKFKKILRLDNINPKTIKKLIDIILKISDVDFFKRMTDAGLDALLLWENVIDVYDFNRFFVQPNLNLNP
jgi:hypothetical protein